MSSIIWHIVSQANVLSTTERLAVQAQSDSLSLNELLKLTTLNEHDLAVTIANYYNLTYQPIPPELIDTWLDQHPKLSHLPIAKWQCLAIEHESSCTLFLADPQYFANTQYWQPHLSAKPTIAICRLGELKRALNHIQLQYSSKQSQQQPDHFEAPSFINRLLQDAHYQQASDIHIEPKQSQGVIRLRIDGLLHDHSHYAMSVHQTLIARLKIMAKLNANEHQHPQDGRFSFSTDNQSIQCRLNTCRLLHEEKAVIRLLPANQSIMPIEQLGFTQKQLKLVNKVTQIKQGLVLVTGPTGSGKTNTLYALLSALKSPSLNITTLENPVEIEIESLNQCNIQPDSDIGFSDTLRALLRQDPDIIMVGEIRDADTAMIALKAAQTGHLVLSTLHTNDSIASILRLQQMGISLPYLISNIELIINQRLVRRLCTQCGGIDHHLCSSCHQGYFGRYATFEVLLPSERLRQHILDGQCQHSRLIQIALEDGMIDLHMHAQSLIEQGITTLEEAHRVLSCA